MDRREGQVLKKLIGKVLGFEQQIQDLRRQVRELSWDSSFGMWTRGAFLQFCHVMPRGTRFVAFIDLNKIHDLNEELGYAEVDRRVKETFSVPFRRSDVVARWYSGDEIVILFDSNEEGAERKIRQLEAAATQQGLTFYHQIGQWEVGKEPVEEKIQALADKVALQKGLSPR
jgi:GGDEF domain-containing protein